jgi:chorismate-pyruvate lyase
VHTTFETSRRSDGSADHRLELPERLDWLDRAMLSGDGTVTTLLESCLGDRIQTRTLRSEGPAPVPSLVDLVGRWWRPDAARLGLASAEAVVARRVVLHDERSGTPYVLADSLIVPGRLPQPVAVALDREGSSIGRLLKAQAVESRREVLAAGLTRAGEAADALRVGAGDELAWREYAIVLGGKATILLTEVVVPGRLMAAASARVLRSSAKPYRIASRRREGPGA